MPSGCWQKDRLRGMSGSQETRLQKTAFDPRKRESEDWIGVVAKGVRDIPEF